MTEFKQIWGKKVFIRQKLPTLSLSRQFNNTPMRVSSNDL